MPVGLAVTPASRGLEPARRFGCQGVALPRTLR